MPRIPIGYDYRDKFTPPPVIGMPPDDDSTIPVTQIDPDPVPYISQDISIPPLIYPKPPDDALDRLINPEGYTPITPEGERDQARHKTLARREPLESFNPLDPPTKKQEVDNQKKVLVALALALLFGGVI